MKSRSILIVEDDRKISDLVEMYLKKEGYKTSVVANGLEGVAQFKLLKPDFIVLDIMLPGIDGIEVARQIRAESNVPILMLTAKSEEFDKVLGLEMGADDYLTKPFSPKELVARIKAIFRRIDSRKTMSSRHIVKISDLEIDNEKMQMKKDGVAIHMSVLEFKLLFALASSPGRVFSRDQLLDRIYENEDEVVLDRTIDVHIKNIRKKLDDNPRDPKYIESVFGAGYRFKE